MSPRLLAPDNECLRRWRKGMFSDLLSEINPKKIMESLMKHRDTERTMGDFLRHGMILKKTGTGYKPVLQLVTRCFFLEAATGFEPVNNGFADRRLTTWLCRLWSGKRDLNPRLQPWQGCTLPLSYSRILPFQWLKITRFAFRCQ
jgi:hypothetical protein